jgi:cold shock CspA family protein
MEKGTIIFYVFGKNFGFIKPDKDGEPDIYFRDFCLAEPFAPESAVRVTYNIRKMTDNHKTIAVNIRRLKPEEDGK